MNQFETALNQSKEVGFVSLVKHSLLYVEGLPSVACGELIYFETGELGQVISITPKYVEVFLLTDGAVRVGSRAAHSGEFVKVHVGNYLLGSVIDPLGRTLSNPAKAKTVDGEYRIIDTPPLGIKYRLPVTKNFESGISVVDLVVPLAHGQRELVIGDRKTGKSQFLRQIITRQVQKGSICVYGAIGKRKVEIVQLHNFFESQGLSESVVTVGTSAIDTPGLVFLTPFTAMTVAEYFRDQGKDVLVILDDMTTQAQYYRQLTLLAGRFPGRSSYPGDVFYIQSRIMERAGTFEKGSITCLPVAESILGDLSGYIQTNLMSMTDGHIFFDSELFNQGRRPAINTFLSVTRVGLQVQSELVRELSRKVGSFLVQVDQMRQAMHFGAELPEEFVKTVALGDRFNSFFDLSYEAIVPLPMTIFISGVLLAEYWVELSTKDYKEKIKQLLLKYDKDEHYRSVVDELTNKSANLDQFIASIREQRELLGI